MNKFLVALFEVLFFIPVFVILSWYCISFLPHLFELNEIQKKGAAIASSAPSILYDISVASETKKSLRTFAMTHAYWYLACKEKRQKMLYWHLNNMLWHLSGYLHFSDEEIFSIWLYYARYEGGIGLNNASFYYFNKPLSELNERGLAALVVVTRYPKLYKPGTEASEKEIEQLLMRLKKS